MPSLNSKPRPRRLELAISPPTPADVPSMQVASEANTALGCFDRDPKVTRGCGSVERTTVQPNHAVFNAYFERAPRQGLERHKARADLNVLQEQNDGAHSLAGQGVQPPFDMVKRSHSTDIDETLTKRARLRLLQLPEDVIVRVLKHGSFDDIRNSRQVCRIRRCVIDIHALQSSMQAIRFTSTGRNRNVAGTSCKSFAREHCLGKPDAITANGRKT